MKVLEILQTRGSNHKMDLALKSNSRSSQGQKRLEERKGQEASTYDGVLGSTEHIGQDSVEKLQQPSEQGLLEDEQMSPSLAIVKMTLDNIDLVLQKVKDNSDQKLVESIESVIEKSQIQACVKLLTEFEDNGDIVEGVYTILEKLVTLCNSDSQTMKEIENQTVLMKQAVMHASYYQCLQSFDFLEALI